MFQINKVSHKWSNQKKCWFATQSDYPTLEGQGNTQFNASLDLNNKIDAYIDQQNGYPKCNNGCGRVVVRSNNYVNGKCQHCINNELEEYKNYLL